MRIAVCSDDTNERHFISRVADELISPKGKIPKISLFPLSQELLETTAQQEKPFDLIFLSGQEDTSFLHHICKLASVVLIGGQHLAPSAFDVGAAYFIEYPVDRQKLEKAIYHCIEKISCAKPYWRRC